MTRKKFIIFSGTVIIVIILIIVIISSFSNSQYGKVKLLYSNPVSSQGLYIKFNNKNASPIIGSYKLPVGHYSLVVQKVGYKLFTTNFNINRSETIFINITLTPLLTPSINYLRQLNIPSINSTTNTISSTQYFYNKTWAFILLNSAQVGNTFVVEKYVASSNAWYPILGPGTYFSKSDISSLPSEVQSYLINNYYASN